QILRQVRDRFQNEVGSGAPGSLQRAVADYLAAPSEETWAAVEALRPAREQAIDVGRRAAPLLEELIDVEQRIDQLQRMLTNERAEHRRQAMGDALAALQGR